MAENSLAVDQKEALLEFLKKIWIGRKAKCTRQTVKLQDTSLFFV